MNIRKIAAASLVLAGLLAAGLAQARSEVNWSISIGGPIGVEFSGQRHHPYPVYQYPREVLVPVPAPVIVYPAYGVAYPDREYGGGYNRHGRAQYPHWDHDGDGIPNRHDRSYTPRWDRDGDGIPNRHERAYKPRWDRSNGIPQRLERRERHEGHDRDDREDRYERYERYEGRGWGR